MCPAVDDRFQISIHALREEGDANTADNRRNPAHFYPRPPRGGRQSSCQRARRIQKISIHALREEGDFAGSGVLVHLIQFLSTPSARRATPGILRADFFLLFLSTPSARRATMRSAKCCLPASFLSTPSARRATQGNRLRFHQQGISIHALREEGDGARNLAPF